VGLQLTYLLKIVLVDMVSSNCRQLQVEYVLKCVNIHTCSKFHIVTLIIKNPEVTEENS